ncbi:helix-turn-helix domain-containing protein [Chitinophagaceae bacterium LWZ2-11]
MISQYQYFVGLSLKELEDYFASPQQESETIEFKTGDCKLDGLYKEVCAMLNTDGGVIILGAPKEEFMDNNKSKTKVCKGPVVPCKENRTPDSVIQTIMTGVTPSPIGIKVHRLDHTDGFIYIIDVPKSIRPPHQVKGRYFIRMGTMSEPAPHGIVEAMMNQKIPVQLRHNLQVIEADHFDSEIPNIYNISIQLTNDSFFPAKNCEIYFAIAGRVRDCDVEKELKSNFLTRGNVCLYNNFLAPRTLIPHIWWTRNFLINIQSETTYIQIILWADETPAKGVLYKYHINEGLSEYNLYEQSETQKEFYKLIRGED